MEDDFDELAYFGYTSELLDHKEVLRLALEAHREGDEDDDGHAEDFYLSEKTVYPGLEALNARRPPPVVQGPSGWIYCSTSFGCLRPHSCLRWMAIHVVEAPWFDPLILLTIMVNCTTMAWSSPLDPTGTPKEALLSQLEWVYLYIFTFELTVKMLAYGILLHPNSYLRDAWCQLDFIVVSLAWLPILFPQFSNMSAIRSVRALRPLRALKRVPGMPVLVGSILKSLPALGNVGLMSTFTFVIFGIVGMNLFRGLLHYRCADPAIYDSEFYEPSGYEPPGAPTPQLRSLRSLAEATGSGSALQQAAVANATRAVNALGAAAAVGVASLADDLLHGLSSVSGSEIFAVEQQQQQQQQWQPLQQQGSRSDESMQAGPSAVKRRLKGGASNLLVSSHWQAEFDSGTFCKAGVTPGSPEDVCAPQGLTCFYFSEDPDSGTVSFDSVAKAMLPILQAVTFDTWTSAMFYIMDTSGYYAGSGERAPSTPQASLSPLPGAPVAHR